MPKPAHTRWSFRGTFGPVATPIEEWNFNINMGEVVFADQAARTAAALAGKTAWDTHLKPHYSSSVVLTDVKVSQVNEFGRVSTTAEGAYNQGEWTGASAGTGTQMGSTPPLQVALCISLETPREGASGKGRFFLPFPRYALGTDYALLAADLNTIGNACSSFLTALDAAVDFGGTNPGANIAVVSSKGFSSPVTAIRVGRMPDTQTRRRGDAVEGYVRFPVTS